MSDAGFATLCTPDGIVLSVFGDSALRAGTPLSAIVARDSRERLQQLLLVARGSVQHALLQMADGSTVETHCAGDGHHTLVVMGKTPAVIRQLCEQLPHPSDAASLGARIMAGSAPDELTVDLWSEVARVNNDLATAHRQLAKTNAELRWLNEQKNLLLGMAAHDLRNPLAVVLGYSQFITMDAMELLPEHRGMLARIEANVKSMLAIVDDVLDFSAIESGIVRMDLSEFAVADLVTDAIDLIGVMVPRKNIEIRSLLSSELPLLLADRRKLSQVLNNLLTNAIKFSHSGSSVTIEALPERDGGVRIGVSDRGVGMTTEQTARLFQPFARVGVAATAGETSTGLGLVIVRRIVEAHQGRVDVSSAPGIGTTVTVQLPASCTIGSAPSTH